jgi:hypothetical protein
LKPTLLIGCSGPLFSDLQVEAVRFTNFRYFLSQLCDALFDGLLHEDRLAEPCGAYGAFRLLSSSVIIIGAVRGRDDRAMRIAVVKSPFHSLRALAAPNRVNE